MLHSSSSTAVTPYEEIGIVREIETGDEREREVREPHLQLTTSFAPEIRQCHPPSRQLSGGH